MSPFELKLQLHGQVSNPYSFSIKQNYKSSATTKASIPPYTEKSWTTPGNYTFTVPAGVTRIRVAVCGGGGGGAKYPSREGRVTGGTGGNSFISTSNTNFQATGGTGGYSAQLFDEYNGTFNYSISKGLGGSPNGRDGNTTSMSSNTPSGGTGFSLSFELTNGSYGKGGNGNSSWSGSGGSGGYNSSYLSVIENINLTITVGKGGTGGGNGSAGTSGFVLIAYGEGIE